MKKILSISAAFAAASTALLAQSLNVTAPGYTGGKLFDATPGFVIEGLAVAPGGDVYYLERDGAFTASTKLYRRSALDGYTAATPLFDFLAPRYGSFALWENGRVFFGENSTGVVRVLNPDLTTDVLGTVAFNYEAAFADGSLFLSHNPGGQSSAQNKISRYDLIPDGDTGLMLGAEDLIIDTPNDYSAPFAINAAGELLYGGTYAQPGVFRFSAAEVAAATGPSNTLALDSTHRIFIGVTSGAIALDGPAQLWQSDFGSLNLLDLGTLTSMPVADNADYGIGQLDSADGRLLVTVTNGSYDHSAVFLIVPEPSAAALLLTLGLAALTPRRRQRKG